MREDIEKIIYYGTLAPSGDNNQAWKFEVKNNEIFLYAFSERDDSVYNSNNASIYTAHGAVIENMIVAARNLDYNPEILLFPDKNNPEITARLILGSKTFTSKDLPLAIIEQRCTNRKKYSDKPLDTLAKEKIEESINKVGYGRIILIDDKEKIKKIAKPLSFNEKLALETKEIHNFLFKHLTWTTEEQEEKRIGMGMKTLELKFPATLIFRMFRFWPIMNFFNKTIRASDLIAKTNEHIFYRSATIGTIVMPSDRPEDIVNTGRLIERIWLEATASDLSMQLLTGIGFFDFKLRHNDPRPFNNKQQELIKKSYQEIARILEINNKDELFLISFRLGYDGEPSERCYRLPPIINWL